MEILVAIISILFIFLWGRKSYHGLPWNWPVIGMLPCVAFNLHRVHDKITEVLECTGGTFLLKGPWFAKMDKLFTVDPANVHYVMTANFLNYPKGPDFKKIFDILGDGIFNADYELWKNQRKLASSLINHQRFYTFLVNTSQKKVEQGLIPVLEHVAKEGLVLDMQNLIQRYAFDTAIILITGYDPGCVSIDFPNIPFSNALDRAEEAVFLRHCLPETLKELQKWLGVGAEKKLSKAWAILDDQIGKYVSVKREELITKGINYKEEQCNYGIDLLTSLINVDETMGLKIDGKFLRDTILNFMVAGKASTGSSLTWFIWLVSTHPEVENKIREELETIIPANEPKENRLFRAEELRKLVYLHAAMCESLRLYPAVPLQNKKPFQEDILPSGHHVNPKITIVIPLYAMGRMPSLWGKDCLEFKPERWISETGTIRHVPSYKFMVFNAGPRICIGKDVAFTQMKTVAASIIHNYQLQVEKGHQVVPNVSIILYMKYGLKVRVTKRWK